MKKLSYLIVAIVALGLIIAGCGIPVVPPVEQDEIGILPNKASGDVWNVPGDHSTIQDAINAATGGEIIIITTDIHSEGIVIIDEDLTIRGGGPSGKTTIKPTTSTGTANAIGLIGRGWFQIHNGATVNFENIVFDGTGKNIFTAVHYHGDSAGGTVENCEFMNIQHSLYQGRGINNYGQHVDVLNCTFNNIQRIGVFTYGSGPSTTIKGCTYTGKGAGDWLDYGIEAGAGAQVTADGNTITDCSGVASTDGSWSAGILATDYYGPGTTITITNNDIYDCNSGAGYGIAIGYNTDDNTVATITGNNIYNNNYGVGIWGSIVTANYNNIHGNMAYGVYNTVGSILTMQNFEYNWWGHASGPGGEGGRKNKAGKIIGKGDAVSLWIDWDPWLPQPVGHTPHDPVPPGLQ